MYERHNVMKALIDSLVPRGGGKHVMEGVAVGLLSLCRVEKGKF